MPVHMAPHMCPRHLPLQIFPPCGWGGAGIPTCPKAGLKRVPLQIKLTNQSSSKYSLLLFLLGPGSHAEDDVQVGSCGDYNSEGGRTREDMSTFLHGPSFAYQVARQYLVALSKSALLKHARLAGRE